MEKLTSMRVFVAVTEAGTLTGAAKALRISNAMVSRHIQELERSLEVRLLNRTTREMQLTPAGHTYLNGCRAVLQDIAQLEEKTKAHSANVDGDLNVVAPTSYGSFQLAPLIAEFKKRYPLINVQLVLTNQTLGSDSKKADVVVHIGAIPDSNLIARRLAEIDLVCVASPDYLQPRELPKSLNDLTEHNCLRFTDGTREGQWLFNTGAEDAEFKVSGDFSASNGDAVRMATLSAEGIAQLPRYMVDADLVSGKLVSLLDEFRPTAQTLFVIYKHRELSATVRAFVDFLVKEI